MATIFIKDLENNQELDTKALAKVVGGYGGYGGYGYYYNYWPDWGYDIYQSPVTSSIGYGIGAGIASGGWNDSRFLGGLDSSGQAAFGFLRQYGIYMDWP